ncbi:MAG: bifunctional (p)ppGpp synthetase/guanosine-3',5'-bis(diphosphate) 3'-pyrophosphohydrolase [Vicinamibacterales bacterium]
MVQFQRVLDKLAEYGSPADLDLVRRAYAFAADGHEGQLRQSGEPYLMHPVAVAAILADMRLDAVAVAAGVLHDVVEDTHVTSDRVAEMFGAEVAHVVAGVTKISAIHFASSEERQAESFRKMLLAMVDDIRVILVKLADRLHNMRTLGHLPEERQRRIAQETLDIFAPIASRLGMSKLKNELEELAFRCLEPEAYESLRGRVEARRRDVEDAMVSLQQTLEERLRAADVHVVRIDGRIKRLFSIHRKLTRQNIDLDRVYDFVALRVITQSVKDCYGALGIIHQTWSPVPGRFKDFIAMPRPNGYQSLHTSVISDRGLPFEVQIRTEEMHQRAEEGVAAHWKYKEGRVGQQSDEHYFQWMRQLLEVQQEIRDPQEFLQNLKVDLYPEEVYLFTPKGEVRSLRRGSTAVDFAYAIHTDVGHQCVGARVNGKMVPLRTSLRNGDIVEILTQPGHRPSRDWLGFAVTSRARGKIKHVLQAEERARSVEMGRRLFEKEARRFDLNPKALLEGPGFAAFAAEYGASKPDELLAHIGYGKISARTVLQKSAPADVLKDRLLDPNGQPVRRPRADTASPDRIKVRGIDDLLVTRARCCNPIRGEKIVGYITRGKGVSVHAASCTNVLNLMVDPERQIDVEWDSGTADDAAYTVRLTMQVEDRQGMLAAISARVSEIDTNITGMDAQTSDESHARIDMTVQIRDVKHLDRVIRALRGIDGVIAVERAVRM